MVTEKPLTLHKGMLKGHAVLGEARLNDKSLEKLRLHMF